MNYRFLFAWLLVLGSVVMAGCPGAEYQGGVTIDYTGRFTTTDTGFEMNGFLNHNGLTGNDYNKISIYLYTENGTLLYSENIGALVNNQLNVSVSIEQVPDIVVFDSPDFWEKDVSSVEYYEKSGDNNFYAEHATSQNELPFAHSRE